ncbi:MAG: FAD-dependent oxidoreductase [Acidobacteriota bacterium]|nr:FAD-dependent oxidoreductase [Acidobacteriota bacterium]
MAYEVVVVGGGLGGLTVAALLAERGMNVCLLEREPRVGGCAASFDKFGYSFEQGNGLYASWQRNEIHDRVFSELPVEPPEVRLLEPSYAVRLPDQSEIQVTANTEHFEESLHTVFPECADNAIAFYRKLAPLSAALRQCLQREPDFISVSRSRRAYNLLSEGRVASHILKATKQTTLEHLNRVSSRFRRFVDVQLQFLAQGDSAQVNYLNATLALSAPREGMFAIRGGAAALADSLQESIKRSGGKIRLDAPVLRLSYDSTGAAVGVDLLSGETVAASKAIVSNLTLWDTYGKLVGLNRTPSEIRKQLNAARGWGAYLLYLAMDEHVAKSLSSSHVLALTGWQDGEDYDPQNNQFLFAAAPSWDSRGPDGKRAVTLHAFTDVDEWFTFHRDETELEQKDQHMLEVCWHQLHAAMPELGSNVEVIETATPRSFYDLTRRKLGMVGGAIAAPDYFWSKSPSYQTSLPNLFIVSDTVQGGCIAGLTRSALVLANKISQI